ncbi:MAG TPA: HAMP domain-containing sensor histidine kinase, partial [Noviherbaspirillum sp.]
FAEHGSLGKYLFLAADINDSSIVPLKAGDISLTADALKLTVVRDNRRATWWLTLQPPRAGSTRGRFEINAIRENPDNTRERDKRVEGWAYAQRQLDGSQVLHFIARIDFKEFAPELERDSDTDQWPPERLSEIRIGFERKDVAEPGGPAQLISYRPQGRAQLSLVSLADSIFDSYSELAVRRNTSSGHGKMWSIAPTVPRKHERYAALGTIRMVNGDMIIAEDKVTRERILPDTNLEFVVTHPGIIIERVVWQTFLALLAVFIVGVLFAIYFARNLLVPIFTLTRRIRHLVEQPTVNDHQLPYSGQKNELGTLARGFNDLLTETRRRVAREIEDQRARQEVEERQRLEEIQIREENMKVIGHEIRSPLQALISMHENDSKSRQYLDRIRKALEHLQGTLRAQQAISSRDVKLEEIDLAPFLIELAANASLAGIHNVDYNGPRQGIFCRVDIECLGDSIENIVKNADRFRDAGTPIHIGLRYEEQLAIVSIANQGRCINDEDIERIFDYGMSTTPHQEGAGDGIGLFVARRYLMRMQAVINARNLEHGVCFDIKLPLFLKNNSFTEIGVLPTET